MMLYSIRFRIRGYRDILNSEEGSHELMRIGINKELTNLTRLETNLLEDLNDKAYEYSSNQ